MTRRTQPKRRQLRNQFTSQSDPNRSEPNQLLEMVLAFDRMVVELSMGIYNVPRHERFMMRAQNQRLHRAVREHLPRITELSTVEERA
jgi:hypothetical protein